MSEQSDLGERCPVCSGTDSKRFLRRHSVPVHQNLLFDSPDAARAIARGDLDLNVCHDCQFVFNAAFDAQLLHYGSAYENSQDASPAFSAYVDSLVRRVAACAESRSGSIVEIGCGKGAFLRKLLAEDEVGARAVGFDPSYVGPLSALDGRLRFERRPYGRDNAIPADVVICRHIVEHVPDPVELLRTAASAATDGRRVRLFVETPSVEWILRHGVPWDFFYEHCSLFTAASLAVAIGRAGYGVASVDRVFGDQYLWAEAPAAGDEAPTARSQAAFAELVDAYDATDATTRVSTIVMGLAERGPTMIWGAGAKGSTFCDLVDPTAQMLAGIVDVNPAKHGKYVAGTGHPIMSPAKAVDSGIVTAVVLNPNYTTEVSTLLAELGSSATVCDLTLEVQRCG